MITSYPVHGFDGRTKQTAHGGFGAFGAQPLMQLLQQARIRERTNLMYRNGLGRNGLGADTNQAAWDAFMAGGAAATYKDPSNLVYCNKLAGYQAQCILNEYTGAKAVKGPIADMQKAVDRLLLMIPAYNLQGQTMQGPVPTGDGTTTAETTFTAPSINANTPPIATEGGYDGIVGDATMKYLNPALILAGMLQAVPDGVAPVFVGITRNDLAALYATYVTQYLTDVADNFSSLYAAWKSRGETPASTPLDITTIPAIAPFVPPNTKIGRTAAIIGAAALMVGITGVASWNAARHKPNMMYEAPALGRRRRRRRARRY